MMIRRTVSRVFVTKRNRRIRLRLMSAAALAALIILSPQVALADDPCLDPPYHGGVVFGDVDWAADFIYQAIEWGIMYGCTDTLFCPNEPVTRAEMAVFLELFVHGASFSPPPAEGLFGDLTGDYAEYACWAEALKNDGITAGCVSTPPLFCPQNTVTRLQMAVFLVKARCILVGQSEDYCKPLFSAVPGCPPQKFDDVPCSHPAERFIATLAELGISAGCSSDPPLFCPDRTISKAEMAVFLVKTVNSIGCATELAPPTEITGN